MFKRLIQLHWLLLEYGIYATRLIVFENRKVDNLELHITKVKPKRKQKAQTYLQKLYNRS